MTPELTEILTRVLLQLGIAAFFTWRLVRSLRSSGLSGWWSLPFILAAFVLKWYVGVPLIVVFLIWLGSRTPSNKMGEAYRFGQWFSRSVLGSSRTKEAESKSELQVPGLRQGAVVNAKVAAGLIVLTAIGTFGFTHYLQRRHHFEPAKIGDGSILLDTETGVECSARFGMKWTQTDKIAVWITGLEAKKAEADYQAYVGSKGVPDRVDLPTPQPLEPLHPPDSVPIPADASPGPTPVDEKLQNLFSAMQAADSKYNSLVAQADSEKVPDPDSSYFKSFPLCKDIR